MEIDDKHIGTIINSLEYSIRYTREWHEKEKSKYYASGIKYPYDYEKGSIQPLQDALNAIKNTIKNR